MASEQSTVICSTVKPCAEQAMHRAFCFWNGGENAGA